MIRIIGVVFFLLAINHIGLGLPDAGTGNDWQMTFNDEFEGNTIDTAKWNGGYGNLPWCEGEELALGHVKPIDCLNDYTGLSVSNGILSLQGKILDYSTFDFRRAAMNTGGRTAGDAKFSQRFGYFEWRAKLPTDVSGEGDGLWSAGWLLPIGKMTWRGGCEEGNEEVDVIESSIGLSTQTTRQVYASIHDYCLNQYVIPVPSKPSLDLSQDFHTYGLLWRDDGSPHGSMQVFFDNVAQNDPVVLDSRANLWDNGVYLINQIIPCPLENRPYGSGSGCTSKTSNRNPFQIDYVRVYKAFPISMEVTSVPSSTAIPPSMIVLSSMIVSPPSSSMLVQLLARQLNNVVFK
jgi:hypothetical protein